YVLAFVKGDLLHLAVDPHFHGHGVVGLDGAEPGARDREFLVSHNTRCHGHRPWRRRTRACGGRASRGKKTCVPQIGRHRGGQNNGRAHHPQPWMFHRRGPVMDNSCSTNSAIDYKNNSDSAVNSHWRANRRKPVAEAPAKWHVTIN